MKAKTLFLLILCAVLLLTVPASAEEVRENPSVYSYAEIVQKLPQMWLANPIEVMEMMEQYPDYTCWRAYDIIGCQSVNNRYTAEIHVNYQFTSEDDYGEFDGASFTMLINSSEDVQKLLELFWLDGMKAANVMGGTSQPNEVVLYFNTEFTMMTVTVSFGTEGIWLVRVDMGLIRG